MIINITCKFTKQRVKFQSLYRNYGEARMNSIMKSKAIFLNFRMTSCDASLINTTRPGGWGRRSHYGGLLWTRLAKQGSGGPCGATVSRRWGNHSIIVNSVSARWALFVSEYAFKNLCTDPQSPRIRTWNLWVSILRR